MMGFVGTGFPICHGLRTFRKSKSPTHRIYRNSASRIKACAEATPEEVKRIARLAQLNLSEDEITTMTPELQKVIGFFNSINEIDVEGFEPMATPSDANNVLREDVPVMFSNVYVQNELPSFHRTLLQADTGVLTELLTLFPSPCFSCQQGRHHG